MSKVMVPAPRRRPFGELGLAKTVQAVIDEIAELYQADMLHMNDAGYALWQSIIAPYLGKNEGGGASASLPSGLR